MSRWYAYCRACCGLCSRGLYTNMRHLGLGLDWFLLLRLHQSFSSSPHHVFSAQLPTALTNSTAGLFQLCRMREPPCGSSCASMCRQHPLSGLRFCASAASRLLLECRCNSIISRCDWVRLSIGLSIMLSPKPVSVCMTSSCSSGLRRSLEPSRGDADGSLRDLFSHELFFDVRPQCTTRVGWFSVRISAQTSLR